MTIDEIRSRLEMIGNDINSTMKALDLLASSPLPANDNEAFKQAFAIPETLDAQLVMTHYTRKSYNDLYTGLRDGKYPAPYTEPGMKRLWKRSDWDEWRDKTIKEA